MPLSRRKVRPGDPSRPTEYRGHLLPYLRARDIWLILSQHEARIATGITRRHVHARVDAILAAHLEPREVNERSTQERH